MFIWNTQKIIGLYQRLSVALEIMVLEGTSGVLLAYPYEQVKFQKITPRKNLLLPSYDYIMCDLQAKEISLSICLNNWSQL
jgi:hypothetical protein